MGRIVRHKQKKQLPRVKPIILANLAKHIGRKLLALRQREQLTLRELGEACGLTFVAVCEIENGNSAPRADTLWKLHQFFKVPVGYFFEGFEA